MTRTGSDGKPAAPKRPAPVPIAKRVPTKDSSLEVDTSLNAPPTKETPSVPKGEVATPPSSFSLGAETPLTKQASDAKLALSKVGKRPTNTDVLKVNSSKSSLLDSAWKFGSPIKTTLEGGRKIPLVVESCIKSLRAYGVEETGLFRVSGSTTKVNELKIAFESGADPLGSDAHSHPPESIASCLKLFLRQVSGSVICQEKYSVFTAIAGIVPEAERLSKLRDALRTEIPRENFDLLGFLCEFLNHVSTFASVNMMGTSNLAVVFGPTLMVAPDDDSLLQFSSRINAMTELMIQQYRWLFFAGPEEANPLEPITEKVPEARPRKPVRKAGDVKAAPSAPVTSTETIAEASVSQINATNSVESSQQKEPGPTRAIKPTPARTVVPATRPAIDRVRAKFDFHARQDTELSFSKGDVMVVFEKPSNNWWYGQHRGKDGYIAVDYVVPVSQPQSPAKAVAVAAVAQASPAPSGQLTPAVIPAPESPKIVAAGQPLYENIGDIRAAINSTGPKKQEDAPISVVVAPVPEPTPVVKAAIASETESVYMNLQDLQPGLSKQEVVVAVPASDVPPAESEEAAAPVATTNVEADNDSYEDFSFNTVPDEGMHHLAQLAHRSSERVKSPVFEFDDEEPAVAVAETREARPPSPAPKPKVRSMAQPSPLRASHDDVDDEDDPNWRPPPPSGERKRSFVHALSTDTGAMAPVAAPKPASRPPQQAPPLAPPKPVRTSRPVMRPSSEEDLPPPPEDMALLDAGPHASIDLEDLPPPPVVDIEDSEA